MNKFLYSVLLFCIACSSNSQMREYDRMADHMIVDFTKTVASKGLRPAGMGGGLDPKTGKHRLFSVTFNTAEEINSLERARALLVETLIAFIDFINARENLRDHLAVFPVTIENVRVSIIYKNAKLGNIVNIANCGNLLYYCARNENPEVIAWVDVHEETFEEAINILSARQAR